MTASSQTLFVPNIVSGARLAELPLSATLASTLKRLKIKSLGDLNGVPLKDFERVSNRGRTLVAELSELIERSRKREFETVRGCRANPIAHSTPREPARISFWRQKTG